MIKNVLLLIAVLFFLNSCKKSSNQSSCQFQKSSLIAPASEVSDLKTWVMVNHPSAIKDTSGLFYEITNIGTGASPTVCSVITMKYWLKLASGVTIDSNTVGLTSYLGSLIVGCQDGIPLIKKGGAINLYIPPTLGYGASAYGPIPANSNLIFNVQLTDVQ